MIIILGSILWIIVNRHNSYLFSLNYKRLQIIYYNIKYHNVFYFSHFIYTMARFRWRRGVEWKFGLELVSNNRNRDWCDSWNNCDTISYLLLLQTGNLLNE